MLPRNPGHHGSVPIVTGLPLGGDHPMHPFAFDAHGGLYVDVATATNSCQAQNRTLREEELQAFQAQVVEAVGKVGARLRS